MGEQAELIPEIPFTFTEVVIDLISLDEYVEPQIPASFQRSIGRYGVMEPIIVCKSGRHDGMYRVVDGRRRATAARRVGLSLIPAVVVSGGDDAAEEYHKITLIANTQRGSNALSEYDAIMELVKSGKSEKQIAVETGMPFGTIKKRLKLNALPKAVIEKVRDGDLSVGAAEEATKLTASQMDVLIAKLTDDERSRVTLAEVQQLREAERRGAIDDLPEQLFMPEVELTVEEKFEADLRSLTNRFDMIPTSKMVGIFHEFIARMTTDS